MVQHQASKTGLDAIEKYTIRKRTLLMFLITGSVGDEFNNLGKINPRNQSELKVLRLSNTEPNKNPPKVFRGLGKILFRNVYDANSRYELFIHLFIIKNSKNIQQQTIQKSPSLTFVEIMPWILSSID
jgi:hypothetical protein